MIDYFLKNQSFWFFFRLWMCLGKSMFMIFLEIFNFPFLILQVGWINVTINYSLNFFAVYSFNFHFYLFIFLTFKFIKRNKVLSINSVINNAHNLFSRTSCHPWINGIFYMSSLKISKQSFLWGVAIFHKLSNHLWIHQTSICKDVSEILWSH